MVSLVFSYYARCCGLPEFPSTSKDAPKTVTKKGFASMSKLFIRDAAKKEINSLGAIPTPPPIEDIQLLSFDGNFSRKLREAAFTIRQPEPDIPSPSEMFPPPLRIIDHNIYKTKPDDLKSTSTERRLKSRKVDECSIARHLLIEAVRLGLDVIHPALQEIEEKGLPTDRPVDEVDFMVVPLLALRPPEAACVKGAAEGAERRKALPERTGVVMGPGPVLDAAFVDEDGVRVEIIASTRPKRMRKGDSVYRPLTKDKTLRFSKRANLVINSVRRERILTLFR